MNNDLPLPPLGGFGHPIRPLVEDKPLVPGTAVGNGVFVDAEGHFYTEVGAPLPPKATPATPASP